MSKAPLQEHWAEGLSSGHCGWSEEHGSEARERVWRRGREELSIGYDLRSAPDSGEPFWWFRETVRLVLTHNKHSRNGRSILLLYPLTMLTSVSSLSPS